jgi:Ca2+-binding EF-hand superfamily protein
MRNREKGSIGLHEIKTVFHQYLDFTISDQDIMEFISEIGSDGAISFEEFATKY